MVSKSQKKLIHSLQQKKYRKIHGLFVAEGKKIVAELIEANFELELLATDNERLIAHLAPSEKHYLISEKELQQLTFLTSAQRILGVFKIPGPTVATNNGLTVVLDEIRDPGNLGTIIRLCDWFGVSRLVCSLGTVDCFNPKVIQATMGSISRVSIHYLELETYFKKLPKNLSVYGTFLNGENLYSEDFQGDGVIVMGNEANGIQESVAGFIDKRLTIPQFGNGQKAESLNVAMATSIILSEFRRG